MTEPILRTPLLDDRPAASPARPLHVAIVDEELPYPPTSGKRIRTLNLLRRLAGRHRLTFLCYRNVDEAEAESAAAHFRELGIETVIVDRVRPQSSVLGRGPAFYAGLAANLLSPQPYVVDVNDSSALRRAVAAYAAHHHVDLWQVEWTPYAAALRELPGSARRLIMAHNVESLIWQRYHETEPNPLKRWYIKHQWRKFERFERDAYGSADQVVAVSLQDAETIRRELKGRSVAVVDNGVDTETIRPSDPAARVPGMVLFLGSLDWRPNLDAVEQLLDVVFPAVRSAEPTARLCIVGRKPPEDLRRRVASSPGVELHAGVADVRPFLARAAVMVVPLRIGGGSRLKILEAFAAGLPVVTTRVGAEGLEVTPGGELLVTEDIAALASDLLASLSDSVGARNRSERARALVESRYDWSGLADRLERIWIETACSQSADHSPIMLEPGTV